jgi:predicted nucleotidyltransferase
LEPKVLREGSITVTTGSVATSGGDEPMKKALTQKEKDGLACFKGALQSLLGDNLLSLRLFGSRARGEGTEESDLDVLVLVKKKDRTLCRRIVEESLEVDLAYEVNLAPTILSADEYRQNQDYGAPFYRNVEREGVSP